MSNFVNSNSNNLETFRKNYGGLIQERLDKIKPVSENEITIAIEALKSLTESGHEVHESLKGRIDAIKELLDDGESWGLTTPKDMENFKTLFTEYTSKKIQLLARLITNKNLGAEYIKGVLAENTKANNDKNKIEKRLAEEQKSSTEKHTMPDDDWVYWREYKYGIQNHNLWSPQNRETGLAIQNSNNEEKEIFLNSQNFDDLVPNQLVFLATFLNAEQLQKLTVDQIYVMGNAHLLKNFALLLVKGGIPFEKLQNLEMEHFQIIVDFAPQVIEYLALGATFEDIASLSIIKLMFSLHYRLSEVKKLLNYGIKWQVLSQISNDKFKEIFNNFRYFKVYHDTAIDLDTLLKIPVGFLVMPNTSNINMFLLEEFQDALAAQNRSDAEIESYLISLQNGNIENKKLISVEGFKYLKPAILFYMINPDFRDFVYSLLDNGTCTTQDLNNIEDSSIKIIQDNLDAIKSLIVQSGISFNDLLKLHNEHLKLVLKEANATKILLHHSLKLSNLKNLTLNQLTLILKNCNDVVKLMDNGGKLEDIKC